MEICVNRSLENIHTQSWWIGMQEYVNYYCKEHFYTYIDTYNLILGTKRCNKKHIKQIDELYNNKIDFSKFRRKFCFSAIFVSNHSDDIYKCISIPSFILAIICDNYEVSSYMIHNNLLNFDKRYETENWKFIIIYIIQNKKWNFLNLILHNIKLMSCVYFYENKSLLIYLVLYDVPFHYIKYIFDNVLNHDICYVMKERKPNSFNIDYDNNDILFYSFVSVLSIAISKHNFEVIDMLLEELQKHSVKITLNLYYSILQVLNNDLSMVELLVSRGIQIHHLGYHIYLPIVHMIKNREPITKINDMLNIINHMLHENQIHYIPNLLTFHLVPVELYKAKYYESMIILLRYILNEKHLLNVTNNYFRMIVMLASYDETFGKPEQNSIEESFYMAKIKLFELVEIKSRFLNRLPYIRTVEGCSKDLLYNEPENIQHIIRYIFNDMVMREICVYI